MATTKVNNPIENDLYRNKVVVNHTAFSTTIDNSTGREYYNETHRSGSGRTYTNQSTIEFNTNNKQTLTKGDSFRTVEGGNYNISGEKEDRVFGDLTIITGAPNLYNTPIVNNWMEEYSEIASAKVQFEQDRGGFANNSGATFERKGPVDKESGSSQGQSFPPNQAQQGMQELLVKKQEKLTEIERGLGNGGNIKLLSGKNILIKAGIGTSAFDTAAIDPVGMKVDKQLEYDGDKGIKKKSTSAPYLEEKDTASNIPFGNLHIESGNGLKFKTGAGGVSFSTNGRIEIAGTSNTIIGGAQILIGSSLNGGQAGSILIRGAQFLNLESANINIKSGADVLVDSGLSVTGSQITAGDLVVGGNLTVLGNIICKGNITADGDIVAGGSGGVSLLNHVHKDTKPEAGATSGPPKR